MKSASAPNPFKVGDLVSFNQRGSLKRFGLIETVSSGNSKNGDRLWSSNWAYTPLEALKGPDKNRGKTFMFASSVKLVTPATPLGDVSDYL